MGLLWWRGHFGGLNEVCCVLKGWLFVRESRSRVGNVERRLSKPMILSLFACVRTLIFFE